MSTSGDSVEVELRVGMLDFALAKLMSSEHHTIEFPTLLLPENVVAGSIIKLQCSRAAGAEIEDRDQFEKVQQDILDMFATNLPRAPVLRARNITQTSAVLEWDNIDIATADLHFMALYKGEQRLGFIPQPLKRTVTKVSNLEIDAPYKFRLVLSTSAGMFESNELEIRTHKMTNLTGVVTCLGSLAHSSISEADIRQTLARLGCKEPQDTVKLDTTHFICSTEGGAAYNKALELNIPIVRPEWLKACESERRLASVRGFYLSVNPPAPSPSAGRNAGATESAESVSKSAHDAKDASAGSDHNTEAASADSARNSEGARSAYDAQSTHDARPEVDGSQSHDSGSVEGVQSGEEANGSQSPRGSEATDAGSVEPANVGSPGAPSSPTAASSPKSDGAHYRSESTDIPGPVVHTGNDFERLAPHDRSSVKSVKSFDIGSDTNAEYIVGSELSREVTADPDAQLRDSEELKVVVQVPDTPEPQSADVLTERRHSTEPEPVTESIDAVTRAIHEEDIEVQSEAAQQIVAKGEVEEAEDEEVEAAKDAEVEATMAAESEATVAAESEAARDESTKDDPKDDPEDDPKGDPKDDPKDETAKDESVKDEPTKDVPTKDESAKDEPTKDEPTKDEPEAAEPEAKKDEPETEPQAAKDEPEDKPEAAELEAPQEAGPKDTPAGSKGGKKKKKNKRK